MNNKKQLGFGLLGLLVVLAIVGAMFWYGWRALSVTESGSVPNQSSVGDYRTMIDAARDAREQMENRYR